MMDLAMVVTTAAIMYLATWSIHYDKMSGIMPSILTVIAATIIMLELAAYMVVLLPILPWSVFTATATLFATCSLARSAEARNKLRGKKSR